MIRVLLADDHPLYLEGLELLLQKIPEFEIAGVAYNGKELCELVRQLKPDVVITDIEMPILNGIEATQIIKKEFPSLPIIGLTMFNDEHLIVDMMEAGANGYILKSTGKEELTHAIHSVLEGYNYLCNDTNLRLSKMLAKSKMFPCEKKAIFNEKELEIIRLICEQFVSKEIADKTGLEKRTIDKYREHIMEKTGAKNVVGIVVYAIREGIYTP